MPRDDDMLNGVPEQVVRVQDALAARSRLVVLKQLLERPMTFAELRERLPSLSLAGIRAAVWDLSELGYITDDSPPGRLRRSAAAHYSVDRNLLSRDIAELLLFLSR